MAWETIVLENVGLDLRRFCNFNCTQLECAANCIGQCNSTF